MCVVGGNATLVVVLYNNYNGGEKPNINSASISEHGPFLRFLHLSLHMFQIN